MGRLYLSSSDAQVTNNRYTFNFDAIKALNFRFETISFPLSWLLFNNETVYFNEGGSTLTFTLNGNYNIVDLLTTLDSGFNGAGALTYTTSYNSNLDLLTVAATGSFQIEWSKCSPRLIYILGGQTTNGPSSTSYTFPNPYDLAGDANLYLHSNFINGNTRISNNNDADFVIPCDSGTQAYVYYQPDEQWVQGLKQYINTVTFYFTDLWGNVIDFRGKNIFFNIEFN